MDITSQIENLNRTTTTNFFEGIFSKNEPWNVGAIKILDHPFNKNEHWSPFTNYNFSENNSSRGFLPANNGNWLGEVGDSVWSPDDNFIPQKSNPDELTWRELKDKYQIEGISFKDGEPDFSEIMKDEVEIDNFTTERNRNFPQADEKLAEKWGCSPRDVADWRKENGYTWHECKDCKTMQLVPSEVHNNVPHEGGISVAKRINN